MKYKWNVILLILKTEHVPKEGKCHIFKILQSLVVNHFNIHWCSTVNNDFALCVRLIQNVWKHLFIKQEHCKLRENLMRYECFASIIFGALTSMHSFWCPYATFCFVLVIFVRLLQSSKVQFKLPQSRRRSSKVLFIRVTPFETGTSENFNRAS